MALVLSHAPPPKTAGPTPKVSGVPAPAKAPVPTEVAGAQAKFRTLLEQASQTSPKKSAEPTTTAKKPGEPAVDRPKDPKKPELKEPKDPKDLKTDRSEVLWAVVAQPTPKVEPAAVAAAKAAGPEAVAAAAEKAKAPKDLRKLGAELNPGAVAQAGVQAQTEGPRAPGTGPKADRSEEKPRVFVVDRRSDKEKERLKGPGSEAPALTPVNAVVEVQPLTKVVEAKAASSEISVSFQTVAGKNRDGFDLKGQAAAPPPRDAATFQQYLVNQGYGQLVDQARIVLKDNNAGEIRMTLYPESLGKVKVALNLDDNSLAGQIYVENQTVKEVFQANMDGLMQAFRDGGYSDLSLQVSVGNGNGNGNAADGQAQSGAQARDYGRQVPSTTGQAARADQIGSWTDRQINLTA